MKYTIGMKLSLPDFMTRHLPPGTSFYLIAGTYSGVTRTQIGQQGASITKVALRFRSFPGQELNFDGIQEMPVGSMDPGGFQTADNRLLLGFIEIPNSGYTAIAMWAPDHAGGQYTVEQEYFFLGQWLVSQAQKNMQMGQILGHGLAAGLVSTMVPFGGLLAKKMTKGFVSKVKEQDRNYDRLDTITTPRLMRDFGHWLMENGAFAKAFAQAGQGQAARQGGPL